MYVEFACPACETAQRVQVGPHETELACRHCHWTRPAGRPLMEDERAAGCPACGCGDLWRQKDFPPKVGLTIVGLGILLSTLAWADLRPLLAIGILMGFALLDLVLYTLMPDVLVCYRCGTRLRQTEIDESHPKFDLEIHERYRQESLRMTQSQKQAAGASDHRAVPRQD